MHNYTPHHTTAAPSLYTITHTHIHPSILPSTALYTPRHSNSGQGLLRFAHLDLPHTPTPLVAIRPHIAPHTPWHHLLCAVGGGVRVCVCVGGVVLLLLHVDKGLVPPENVLDVDSLELVGVQRLAAHGALPLVACRLNQSGIPCWKEAVGALCGIPRHQVLPRRYAERRDVQAVGALQLGLGQRRPTRRARRVVGLPLLLDRLAHNALDLLLVLVRHMGPVFWLHQDAGVLVCGHLEAGALALDHCGRQDGHHVLLKPVDASCDSEEHQRRAVVIPELHQALHEYIRVQQSQVRPKRLRDAQTRSLQILAGLEKERMRHLVLAEVLLVAGDEDGRARGALVVA
mmetsp:Transcript_22400/g.63983  ORF Transcript_22400/g.63983 Transcript_22400/m.63983 type:complete len:344 (-) Transcript_22400:2558-3589(-)